MLVTVGVRTEARSFRSQVGRNRIGVRVRLHVSWTVEQNIRNFICRAKRGKLGDVVGLGMLTHFCL